MNLPSEIMRDVLLCADIRTVMAARQCATLIDTLMDFNFWHDRFDMDDVHHIFASKNMMNYFLHWSFR